MRPQPRLPPQDLRLASILFPATVPSHHADIRSRTTPRPRPRLIRLPHCSFRWFLRLWTQEKL